jgi:hypothetical protein
MKSGALPTELTALAVSMIGIRVVHEDDDLPARTNRAVDSNHHRSYPLAAMRSLHRNWLDVPNICPDFCPSDLTQPI